MSTQINDSSLPTEIKTIGIMGGGQLGRMLAQSALPLGLTCTFLEANIDCPANAMGKVYAHPVERDAFIQSADVFTLEFENTLLTDADAVLASSQLYPPKEALSTAQNRLLEKGMFDALGIPVAKYAEVRSLADIYTAIETLGLPLVLKTAQGGYDGKGQFVLRDLNQAEQAWSELGAAGQLIAEAFVPFLREVSIIAVRDQHKNIKSWDLAENHHHHGILSHSIVPAPDSQALQQDAFDYISRVMTHLNYVGVMTLELFVTEDGLVANEIAPRVHNSGHWTIEGAVSSQFENHMRAVAGLPLGSTALVQPCLMINIIGQHPKTADVLAVEGAHLHLYGKSEREGRKLGHITLMATPELTLSEGRARLAQILPNPLVI